MTTNLTFLRNRNNQEIVKANKKEYKRLTNEFIVSERMAFYEDKDVKLTFHNFCNERSLNSKRFLLMRIGK